jgi:O-methyltransferase
MASILIRIRRYFDYLRYFKQYRIFKKYRDFTMIPVQEYMSNLQLVERVKLVNGSVVECGVWRGGMIAGISEILGNQRDYYLFDSFEGLPDANDIDGEAALKWQSDKSSKGYFDNCRAEIDWAEKAMNLAQISKVHLIKGWFSETLPATVISEPIALLRLDADWYESTMTCFDNLFDKVATNGLIIIDDYHTWDGCSKAVHDFLSKNERSERISQFKNRTVFIIKK